MVKGNDELIELFIQENALSCIDNLKSKVTDPSQMLVMRCDFECDLGRKATKKLAGALGRFGFDVEICQESVGKVHAWRSVPYDRIIGVLNTAIFVAKLHSAELVELEFSINDKM